MPEPEFDDRGAEAALRTLRAELADSLRTLADAAAPVDLDEPIGRVSRADALQQQQMAKASQAAARVRLTQVDAALARLAAGEYGACVDCGEDQGPERLRARPEAPFCLACQSRREGAQRR